jgi:hypothetical protein
MRAEGVEEHASSGGGAALLAATALKAGPYALAVRLLAGCATGHAWTSDERLGAATGSLNDGGVAYGAGIGVEFDVFRASALFVGLEWSRHDTNDVGVNLSFEDYSGVVGLAFRF